MSEQQMRGTLASGGTFIATGRGIDVFDPAGNPLASFDREVISGVSRDGQVVTLERHQDTIVTLTAASITDAVGLEQHVRDAFLAPPAPPQEPLAFDAFDTEPAPDAPEPEPSEPEPPVAPPLEQPAMPPPEVPLEPEPAEAREEPPPSAPPPEPPEWERPPVEEPAAPVPPVAPGAPTPPPQAYQVEPEEPKRRRWWLWGCLGCGGLIVLTLICIGVLLATEVIDPDDFDDDDDNNNNVIVVTNTPEPTGDGNATPTPTEANGGGGGGGGGGGSPTAPSQEGMLQAGETATVGTYEVTYLDVRTDSTGNFPPSSGNQYLLLTFRVTNSGTEPAIVSSLLQFELRDGAGEMYIVTLSANNQGSVDVVDLEPGNELEGEVAFEVPEGGGPFVVIFTDVFSGETAEWAVNS